jgi:hypothetical protein
MRHDRNIHRIDLTGRIKSLEHFTGSLVARQPEGGHEPDPVEVVAPERLPTPRRSRIFLRGGGGGLEAGHGVFAELTLTAPPPSLATD